MRFRPVSRLAIPFATGDPPHPWQFRQPAEALPDGHTGGGAVARTVPIALAGSRGRQKLVDTEGRVDRFQKKFARAREIQAQKKAAADSKAAAKKVQ